MNRTDMPGMVAVPAPASLLTGEPQDVPLHVGELRLICVGVVVADVEVGVHICGWRVLA
jgi:hypothetical protein